MTNVASARGTRNRDAQKRASEILNAKKIKKVINVSSWGSSCAVMVQMVTKPNNDGLMMQIRASKDLVTVSRLGSEGSSSAEGSTSGMVIIRMVPAPAGELTSTVPPRAVIEALMVLRIPNRSSAWSLRPRPLSRIVIVRASAFAVVLILAVVAAAWRSIFLSASTMASRAAPAS